MYIASIFKHWNVSCNIYSLLLGLTLGRLSACIALHDLGHVCIDAEETEMFLFYCSHSRVALKHSWGDQYIVKIS